MRGRIIAMPLPLPRPSSKRAFNAIIVLVSSIIAISASISIYIYILPSIVLDNSTGETEPSEYIGSTTPSRIDEWSSTVCSNSLFINCLISYPSYFGTPRIVVNNSSDVSIFFDRIGDSEDVLHIVISTSTLPSGQSLADFVDSSEISAAAPERLVYLTNVAGIPGMAVALNERSGITFYDAVMGNREVLQIFVARPLSRSLKSAEVARFRAITDEIVSRIIIR